MHSMDKSFSELHGMLCTAEVNLKGKTKEVHMIKGGPSFKKASGSKVKKSTPTQGKGKALAVYKPKAKLKGKGKVDVKDVVCYFCQGVGHL